MLHDDEAGRWRETIRAAIDVDAEALVARAVRAWREASAIGEEPLFRAVDRHVLISANVREAGARRVPPLGGERCRNMMRRLLIVGLTAAVVVALPLAVVAGLAGLRAGWGARTAGDRSVSCGTLVVPRCFGGVTADDIERPLEDVGFQCAFVQGTEHSIYRCTAGAQFVDVEVRGRLVTYVVANSPQGGAPSSYRTMFEAVARAPFPRDATLTGRALSWVDANLDGRGHETSIAGYDYTLDVRPPWPRLWVEA